VGQLRQDVIVNAVDKVNVVLAVTAVGKGQYRNRLVELGFVRLAASFFASGLGNGSFARLRQDKFIEGEKADGEGKSRRRGRG
jgi:hypothetical protein